MDLRTKSTGGAPTFNIAVSMTAKSEFSESYLSVVCSSNIPNVHPSMNLLGSSVWFPSMKGSEQPSPSLLGI